MTRHPPSRLVVAGLSRWKVSSIESPAMKMSLDSSGKGSGSNPSTQDSSQGKSGLTANTMKQHRLRGEGLTTLDEDESGGPEKLGEINQIVYLEHHREFKDDDSLSMSNAFENLSPNTTWSTLLTEAKAVFAY